MLDTMADQIYRLFADIYDLCTGWGGMSGADSFASLLTIGFALAIGLGFAWHMRVGLMRLRGRL